MRPATAVALVVRLVHALTIRTAFAPDEYWQSIEVAHRLVFGYGHLTWEWAAGLRSYAHPLLFAGPYALLKALGLDSRWAVVRVPLLLQALAAAATDVYVSKLAALIAGPQAAAWCLLCQLASWFNAYCLVRTYSNSLEAALTAAGAYHWLRCQAAGNAAAASNSRGRGKQGRRQQTAAASQQEQAQGARRYQQRAWLACAALSVVFRPASALFWVLPAALQLWRERGRRRRCWLLLLDAVAIGGGILGAAAVVDRIFYGRWVSVLWQFLRFNLLSGSSAQYGSHPWHWNLSQGLPAVAATLLPLMGAGLTAPATPGGSSTASKQLALLAAWSLAVYSLPAHKEHRFLLPALQLLMPFCGMGAASAAGGVGSTAAPSLAPAPAPQAQQQQQQQQQQQPRQAGQPRKLWRWGALACLLLQLPVAAYFMLVHQRAQVDVMHLIAQQAQHDTTATQQPPPPTSVLFLTPCHSTPFYTHVHQPLPMRFLDCSPVQHAAATSRLNTAAQAWLHLPPDCGPAASHAMLSQRRCFEAHPETYLGNILQLNPRPQWPRLVVGFAPLMRQLGEPLQQRGYRLRASLSNCWIQTDEDSPCQLQLWSL